MTRPLVLGQELEVHIDRLAYHSGHGVGRHQGMVVFVPFTAPGDSVVAKVSELHASYAVADLLQLNQESPSRRMPPCPVAGTCGGCKWQHVTYEEQVRQKQEQLISAFHRLQRNFAIPIRPIIPAPNEFRYRNRIQVHRHNLQVGFYASGSNRLIAVKDCLLAEPLVSEALAKVEERAQSPQAPLRERVEIARLKDGKIEIRPSAEDDAGGRFSQVNEAQNLALIETLKSAVLDENFATAIDLYCGSGNLTFPLAAKAPQASWIGIEASPFLINLARSQQQATPGAERIQWAAEPTAKFLRRWKPPKGPLLVVLDPPRPGCDKETREAIGKLRPRQIIYVSCNPTTLARDLESWLQTGDYQVDFLQGLDMFPQTAHLEAIASLQLRSDS